MRAKVRDSDIIVINSSNIWSFLEYASPVCFPGLTQQLSHDTEAIIKRCLTIIIYSAVIYAEALMISGLERAWRKAWAVH